MELEPEDVSLLERCPRSEGGMYRLRPEDVSQIEHH